jgi:integrase
MTRDTRKIRIKKLAQPKAAKRGAMKPFSVEQVNALSTILRSSTRLHALRDFAMFRTGIDTMLRSIDLLRLTVDDVTFNGEVRQQFSITQRKTSIEVIVSLSDQTRAAISDFLRSEYRPEPGGRMFRLTTRRYQQIVDEWAGSLNLDKKLYSTHSMRRTKASQVYKKTGNLAAVKELLGHTDLRHTQLYLGVSKQDAIDLALSIEI